MNEQPKNVLYWNCASGIFNKIELLKDKTELYDPEIFFVAESNINNDMNTDLLQIRNYNFTNSKTIAQDRKSRICCYYKNKWKLRDDVMSVDDKIIALEHENNFIIGIYIYLVRQLVQTSQDY